MTPEELSAAVRERFAYAARYVSLLAQNNPRGSPSEVLTRPDVDAVLSQTLEEARTEAADAVREAWARSSGPQSTYLSWLIDDVDRSYDALGLLRNAIRYAWNSVVGSRYSSETGLARATAVRDAILKVGDEIAMRNALTLDVASAAAHTLAQVAQGEEHERAGGRVYKKWLCSSDPPDDRTCHWCRALHGMVIPLHANFPVGDPADLTGHGNLTKPPRPYHGVLPGPPRHPRCRCRVVLVFELEPVPSEGGQEGAGVNANAPHVVAVSGAGSTPSPAGFLAASDIREMPEDKFNALLAFLDAAQRELAQVLARLKKAVRRGRGS